MDGHVAFCARGSEQNLQLSVRSDLRRLPDHDVHSDILLVALEVDVLDDFEAHLGVDEGIDVV